MELNITMFLLLGAAALTDLRYRKIPNWLILTGLIFGLVLSVMNSGTAGLVTSAFGFALGFVLLLPGYLLRFTGAGDLKLFATLGVYCGPVMLLQVFVASILIGACLVMIQALIRYQKSNGIVIWQRYRSMLQTLLTTGHCSYVPPEPGSLMSQRLPMAPIFAIGALVIFCLQLISN
jgi:prepilin peptidase CpaA